MTPPLQVGDRVRLSLLCRRAQFQPGDTGTIVALLPPSSPQGTPLYQIRMDAGEATLYPAYYEDELERA